MICAFCNNESAQYGWDESSHLGKRPICYSCIGERDIRRLREEKPITLYLKNKKLVNQVGTLAFKIIEQIEDRGTKRFYFLFNKRRWEGTLHSNHSTRVTCCKYKSSSKIK